MKCESGSCQHAKQPWCVCECGGARHGTAPLKWAECLRFYDPNAPHTKKEQDDYAKIEEWRTSAKWDLIARCRVHSNYNKSKLAQKDVIGVLMSVRLNTITDYLKDNQQTNDELLSIVDIIDMTRACAVEVVASAPEFSKRLGDHFWCDLTVALVQVLQALATVPNPSAGPTIPLNSTQRALRHMRGASHGALSDEMIAGFEASGITSNDWRTVGVWFPRAVWMQLKENRSQSYGIDPTCSKVGSDIPRATRDGETMLEIMEAFVHDAVLEIMAVFFARAVALHLQPVIFKLQILTLLLCPDPYAHEDVWNSCVVPLIGGQQIAPVMSKDAPETGGEKLLKFFTKALLYRRR